MALKCLQSQFRKLIIRMVHGPILILIIIFIVVQVAMPHKNRRMNGATLNILILLIKINIPVYAVQ